MVTRAPCACPDKLGKETCVAHIPVYGSLADTGDTQWAGAPPATMRLRGGKGGAIMAQTAGPAPGQIPVTIVDGHKGWGGTDLHRPGLPDTKGWPDPISQGTL